MRLTRLFSAEALQAGSVVSLSASAATHVARVLRLRAGAALTLFDGRGGEYEARLLDSERGAVRVQVGEPRPIEREAVIRVRLLQCVARGERMDWIVQKATELGVASIVPARCDYSVVQLDAGSGLRRMAHWRSVAISACEQCGRNRLPEIGALQDLASACRECADGDDTSLRLLLSPAAEHSLPALVSTVSPAGTISLLVGPEGGLSDGEHHAARRHGFRPVRLGPRVLRAETAPLAALAAIQALVGDFI